MINGAFLQGFAFGRRPRKAVQLRSPILSWRMDEASGSVIDYSGNGYTGRIDGSPTRNATVYGGNKGIQLTASGHGVSIDKGACPLALAALESQTCTISMVFENSTAVGTPNPCPFVIWNNAGGGFTTLRLGGANPGYANWSSSAGSQNYGSIQDATVTGLKIITYVRTPSEGRLYVDGILVATKVHSPSVFPATSSSDRIQVGGHLNFPASYQYRGRASDLNIWNVALTPDEVVALVSQQGRTLDQRTNIDPYAANVISLLNFNGTNGSTSFFDEKGNAVLVTGSATISTEQSLFGGSSLKSVNGGYVYLTLPQAIGTSDFTLECFAKIMERPSAGYSFGLAQVGTATDSTGGIGIEYGRFNISPEYDVFIGRSGYSNLTSAAGSHHADSFPLPWHHLGIQRLNGVTRFFAEGLIGGSISLGSVSSTTLRIGFAAHSWGDTSRTLYIDSFRLTLAGRYPANQGDVYQIPTQQF